MDENTESKEQLNNPSETLKPAEIVESFIYDQMDIAGQTAKEKVITSDPYGIGFRGGNTTPEQIESAAKNAEYNANSEVAYKIALALVEDLNIEAMMAVPGLDKPKIASFIADDMVIRKYDKASREARQAAGPSANELAFK